MRQRMKKKMMLMLVLVFATGAVIFADIGVKAGISGNGYVGIGNDTLSSMYPWGGGFFNTVAEHGLNTGIYGGLLLRLLPEKETPRVFEVGLDLSRQTFTRYYVQGRGTESGSFFDARLSTGVHQKLFGKNTVFAGGYTSYSFSVKPIKRESGEGVDKIARLEFGGFAGFRVKVYRTFFVQLRANFGITPKFKPGTGKWERLFSLELAAIYF